VCVVCAKDATAKEDATTAKSSHKSNIKLPPIIFGIIKI